MAERIVIALGGNALGKNLPEQMAAVKHTAKAIVDLIEAGYEVVVSHGNGPQVGMINTAMTTLSREDPSHPMAPEDPAFQNPTKPIGTFMTKAEAEEMRRRGNAVMEDAGRGWRRCVASPLPRSIIEIETIRTLVEAGQVVVAAGGGGIPVYPTGRNHLKGAGAVIDKDFASELLAEELNADVLIILTAVEKVAVNFGKPEQTWLDRMTPAEASRYAAEGQFAPGSMLPKVQAAVRFAESRPGRRALITLLEKAGAGIAGETGTTISM